MLQRTIDQKRQESCRPGFRRSDLGVPLLVIVYMNNTERSHVGCISTHLILPMVLERKVLSMSSEATEEAGTWSSLYSISSAMVDIVSCVKDSLLVFLEVKVCRVSRYR